MRRGLTWFVAVPAMLAGSQAAHSLAYRIAFPNASVRLHVLALTGHGYLARLPLALALAGALGLVGLAFAAWDAAHGRRVRELSPLAFALLPPLAFTLQEILELSLHTGQVGWRAVAAPTFLPGLALQLPFAALAYLAARFLLRAAVQLGRALAQSHAVAPAARLPRFCNRFAAALQTDCTASPRAPPLAVGI
jgi:hypothetical protein